MVVAIDVVVFAVVVFIGVVFAGAVVAAVFFVVVNGPPPTSSLRPWFPGAMPFRPFLLFSSCHSDYPT
jgi:hypothetical protein